MISSKTVHSFDGRGKNRASSEGPYQAACTTWPSPQTARMLTHLEDGTTPTVTQFTR